MTPRALLDESFVWDNHGCMPLRPHDADFLPQLARYKANGVNAVTLNIGFGEQGIEEHVRVIANFRRWLAENDRDYMLATSVEDIERARRDGKLAVMFDIEGMNAVADQTSMVQLYYDLGVRWMLVAYNRNNPAGGGCQDEDQGLSAFGRQILDEMARVGMIACCSHTGPRTVMDVMAYSSRPVIFSHSNARALHDHERNIADDQIMACAAQGGVIGINGVGLFLGDGDATDRILAHIDYMCERVGAAHVGLGLDSILFCQPDDALSVEELGPRATQYWPPHQYPSTPMAFAPIEVIPEIVTGMKTRGYSEADIAGILGGNFARIAATVWKPVAA